MFKKKLTTKYFINKATEIHLGKYLYDNVQIENSRKKVSILCKLHGVFMQRPSHHLNGQGCPICKKRSTIEIFIQRAKIIHGDKFDYSKAIYTTNRTPICIVCPFHGEFYPTPTAHLKGHGCMLCNHIGKYTYSFFNKFPEKKSISGILYVIKMTSNEEEFFKIGITTKTIKKRFEKDKMFNIETYLIIKGELYTLFETEQCILREIVSNDRYIPKTLKGGNLECFSEDVAIEVINHLQQLFHL